MTSAAQAQKAKTKKTRTLTFQGRDLTVTPKGSVQHNGGRCSVYGLAYGEEDFEDIIMPTGRALVDHLEMTGGPVRKAQTQSPPKRRGRPPKDGTTKTNLERQRVFQARIRRAPGTIESIKNALAATGMIAAEKVILIEDLIKVYESEG